MTQTKIPRKIEKQVYQEANSRCAVCRQDDVTVLTVHHIIPYAEDPRHDPAHMLLLCANCHAKADRGEIPREKLYSYKRCLTTNIIPFPKRKSSKDRISVVGDGNVTAGRDIHVTGDLNYIKIPKGKKSSHPIIIPGTVAEDARMYGYLNYLVNRYNEFKKWECKTSNLKMNYPQIRVAYKRKMKYSIKDTPRDIFPRGMEYLQRRIRETKLGRIMTKRGQELFSSFDTFDEAKSDGH